MNIRQSAGKSYAYLLGVYLGDGCVTNTADGYPVFRLNTIDEDFALAVKDAIKEVSTYPVNICKHEVKRSNNPNYSLRCGDPSMCRNLVMDTAAKESLPDIKEWSRDEKHAFISGLMDSEGFVAATSNNHTGRRFYMGFKCCDPWVMDFARMLQSVGIRHGKVQVEAPYKEGYKPATRFTIKMQSWVASGVRFNIMRKQRRVDEWAATEPYTQRSRFPRKLSSETLRQAA